MVEVKDLVHEKSKGIKDTSKRRNYTAYAELTGQKIDERAEISIGKMFLLI